MNVKEISTDNCNTVFSVEYKGSEFPVRLWAIVGGQMALGLESTPYISQRFNINPLYAKDAWLREESRYKHQNPNRVIGPRLEDLHNAEGTLLEFMDYVYSTLAIYEPRAQAIFNIVGDQAEIKSKRFRDKANRVYGFLKITLVYGGSYRFSRILTETSAYSGSFDTEFDFPFPDWGKANSEIEAVKKENDNAYMLYQLTDAQFSRYLGAIRLLWQSKDTRQTWGEDASK
jgi:hypothetical protein